jgi:hypothetical protein
MYSEIEVRLFLRGLDCASICDCISCVYVSSYCYICVLILLCACPHTAIYVSSYCHMCVLRLQYVSSYSVILLYVPSYCYIRVLLLLYMCPHTAICVLIQRHTAAICVFILQYMCPRTAIYVSSYCYMGPHTAWSGVPPPSPVGVCGLKLLVCRCMRKTTSTPLLVGVCFVFACGGLFLVDKL